MLYLHPDEVQLYHEIVGERLVPTAFLLAYCAAAFEIPIKAWIRQALARGYCTKENEGKVLDSQLVDAMASEVEKIINVTAESEVERLAQFFLDERPDDILEGSAVDDAIRLLRRN